jgi:uncharacterized protein YbbC (DUF1343 family)/CubicO group peptidase (beta-lactamase class C family)
MTRRARRPRFLYCLLASLLLVLAAAANARAVPPKLPRVDPAEAGFRPERLEALEPIIQEAIAVGRMPGCVLAFGRGGRLAWLRAYGHRQLEPDVLPMTVDTVFDLASITKPVATATSVMMLVERGRLRLRDAVTEYLPEFGVHGKQTITLIHLLTHHAGLIADNSLSDYQQGPEEAWQRILQLELSTGPEQRFVYSDVGFIVLGELVRQASGMNVHQFTQQHLFSPLGMTETGYLPAAELRARAAPTEQREGQWICGDVHDPRAYKLVGIAGHAGLFSTAEDLAVYAQMMLQEGTYAGQRILSPATVRLMTRAYDVSGAQRGLGWDKLSGYSSNRAENFSERAYGHGGFTGTVLWIDPEWDLFFIFLSNRVHPHGNGNVNSLAGRLATVVTSAIEPTWSQPSHDLRAACSEHVEDGRDSAMTAVLTGLDVLVEQDFAPLKGQRVGLITNHTGVDRTGVSNVQLLHTSPRVHLVALFSPEHGLSGERDVAHIDDARDATTGLAVYSLYGPTRRPTAAQLASIDTLVFDIQDIGTRFYTYISTMGLALQAASEHKKRFVVLDRPNPINGIHFDGPVLDEGKESFVGFHTLPVRHGMTVGELARMFAQELELEVDLHVVEMNGWRREQYFDQTGLPWINPSPNMRNLNQSLLYPGIGLLETTNLSVGRGTDTPFERIGAPWIDGRELARELNASGLPGVRFTPVTFRPSSSVFEGEDCQGVHLLITHRDALQPLEVGFEIATTLRRLYPDRWDHSRYLRLLADEAVAQAVARGASRQDICRMYRNELDEFAGRRRSFLLYGSSTAPTGVSPEPRESRDRLP